MGWVVNVTPRPLYPQKRPGTHCTAGWVGPRAILEGAENLSPPTGIRFPDRSARNESLYRLSCPGSLCFTIWNSKMQNPIKYLCLQLYYFQGLTIHSQCWLRLCYIYRSYLTKKRKRWRSRLRHCAISRAVTSSIPDRVIVIFSLA